MEGRAPGHDDCFDGEFEWGVDDKLPRDAGPTKRHATGQLEWWQHGTRHRLDGPAVDSDNGTGDGQCGYIALWVALVVSMCSRVVTVTDGWCAAIAA